MRWSSHYFSPEAKIFTGAGERFLIPHSSNVRTPVRFLVLISNMFGLANQVLLALSDYGPRVEEFTDSLLVRIGKNVGKPISINEIVVHYSYDVMSAMAFGKAMGFVKGDSNEDANQILANLQKWIFTASLGMHVPWLMNSLTSFTSFGGPMKQFYLWSEKQVTIRTEVCHYPHRIRRERH